MTSFTNVPTTAFVVENTYSVNWNYQQTQILDGLKNIFGQDDLTDVILACDGELIQAHKLVLSLCSSFFRNLFQRNKADKANTIVIMGNVSAVNLKYLLQFIYQGKVDIPSRDVDSFLQAGKMLQIEGLLTSDSGQTITSNQMDPSRKPVKRNVNRRFPRRNQFPSVHLPGPSFPRKFPRSAAANDPTWMPRNVFRTPEVITPEVLEPPEEVQHPLGAEGEGRDNEGIVQTVKSEPVEVCPDLDGSHQSVSMHIDSMVDDFLGSSMEQEGQSVVVSQSSSGEAPSTSFQASAQPGPSSGSNMRQQNTDSEDQGRNKGRTYKKKSLAWRYFEIVDDATKMSRCKLCLHEIRTFGVTSNLLQHLRRNHRDIMFDPKWKKKPN